MKIFAAGLALAVIATPALAAGPEAPVKAVMDVTQSLWNETAAEGTDYFDAQRLGTLYSKSFAETYRGAAKFPIYDEGGGPFGYDVITNSQDGCPIEDVKIETGASTGAVTGVKVTFKLWTCVNDDPKLKDSVSEVHFDVVTENGVPVINDIHRSVDGVQDSLVKEMQDIIKAGKE